MKLEDREIAANYGVDERGGETDYFNNEPKPEEVSVKMPKAKYGYSIICLILIVAVVAVSVIAINLNSAYIYVSVFFSDVTYGYNPDGSAFDIYEALSDEALQLACEKLDNKVDVQTLKKHLSVSSDADNERFDALKQNILDSNNTDSYFPSNYKISYKVISDAIWQEGIISSIKAFFTQFTIPSKTKILQSVAESYKEYYETNYVITSDLIFNIDWSETESLDYYNRADEMTDILNRMKRYTQTRYDEDVTFLSEDKISFGDLSAEISGIIQNDIASYKSFVIQNGITSDRDSLLKQFTYVLNTNKEQATRSRGEYQIIMDGISIYDPNVTKLLFIPALDSDDEFYMNRTKIGIDYLTEDASTTNLTGDEAENNAQYYEYLISQFESTSSNDALRKSADAKSEEIIAKINDLCEKATVVNDEYLNNYSYNEIVPGTAVFGAGFVSSVVKAVKLTIMWASILCVLWFIYSFLHKKKRA